MNKDNRLIIQNNLYINYKSAIFSLVFSDALSSGLAVSISLFAKYIIDYALDKNEYQFKKYLLVLAVIFAVELVAKLISQRISAVLQGKLEIDYKSRIFGEILEKDYSAINSYHSGELLNRLTSDVNVISSGITSALPNFASFLTRLVVAIVIMVSLDKTFVGLLLLGGIFCIVVSLLFRKPLKSRHKAFQEAEGKLRSFLQEGLESLLVIRVFSIANKINAKALGLQKEKYKQSLRKNTITIVATTGLGMFFLIGYGFALAWCAVKLYNGSITAGSLTAMLQLVNQIQMPLTMLAAIIPSMFSILASAERLTELEAVKTETVKNTEDIDTDKLYDNLKDISFENVTFSYDRDTVLEHADLTINKGDFAAITGISGIGKSTLFKLMLGVLEPTEGEIWLEADKKYYSDIKTRKMFSYVPQGNMLFSGTIRENIAFIKTDASDEEIMKAAETACADSFINELPEGLNTVIGEKGHGLSEGQVQRLAVARAILCNAPVILLDEATSALDEATEEQLLQNIKAIPNTTCIIISHKAAAKRICNVEIRIEDKKIMNIR